MLGAYTTDTAAIAGRVLSGRYILEAPIGVGGMGMVVRAHHAFLDRTVAIKLLLPELLADEVQRERFLREAKVASAVDHPGVVRITDFGVTQEQIHFLVMEHLAGRTLRQLLRDTGPLGWPDVTRIGVQLCEALHAIGAHGVVHRDLKPENVWVCDPVSQRRIKVLDFGIAGLAAGSGATATITGAGMALGTPDYMAPEQVAGEGVDGRTDLYALGCILWELLCGRRLFADRAEDDVLMAHLEEEAPAPAEHVPGIPGWLNSAILLCLQKERRRRPGSAAVLGRMLSEGLGQEPSGLVVERPMLPAQMSADDDGPPTDETADFWARTRRSTDSTPEEAGTDGETRAPRVRRRPAASAPAVSAPHRRPMGRRWPLAAWGAGLAALLGAALMTTLPQEQSVSLSGPIAAPPPPTSPPPRYFANVEWRNGALEGLGPVSASSGVRAVRYAFDASGRVVRRIGPQGRLAPDDDGFARWEHRYAEGSAGSPTIHRVLEQDEFGETVRVRVYDQGGRRAQLRGPDDLPLRLEEGGAVYSLWLTWGDDGRERERRCLSANPFAREARLCPDGSWGYRLEYPSDAPARRVRSYLGPDGRDHPDRRGVAQVVERLDDEGSVIRVDHTDPSGKPTPGLEGCASLVIRRGPSGGAEETTCLDEDGAPRVGRSGWAVARRTWEGGREQGVAWFDAKGAPLNHDGAHRWRYTYDPDGRLVERQAFDAAGAPTLCSDGFHGERTAYDAAGRRIERAFVDPRGKLTHRDGGCAREVTRWRSGRRAERSWFGPDGDACVRLPGAARIAWAYDERGRLVGERRFGADGKLREGVDGFARVAHRYDPRRNRVETRYFGSDGAPALNHDGVAIIKRSFDPQGRLAGERYYGVDEKPTMNARGIGGRELTWTRDGLERRLTWLGADGRPQAGPKGWTRRLRAYDERGHLTAESWKDDQGRLRNVGGVARVTTRHDRLGRPLEWSWFDSQGRPARGERGVARILNRYDPRGRLVEERAFDPDGKAATRTRQGARRAYDFDAMGRRVETRSLNEDGALVLTSGGWAVQRSRFDSRGNELRRELLGTDRKPIVVRRSRSAGWIARYDARGRQVESAKLGVDGKPVADKSLVTFIVSRYNPYGGEVERRFLDSNRKPAADHLGVAVRTTTWDERRRMTGWETRGLDGQPVGLPGGMSVGPLGVRRTPDCHRMHRTYRPDSFDRITERFGVDGARIDRVLDNPVTPKLNKRRLTALRWRHRDAFGTSYGLVVFGVDMDGPAYAAGVRPGDVLVRLGTKALNRRGDIDTHLASLPVDAADQALVFFHGDSVQTRMVPPRPLEIRDR